MTRLLLRAALLALALAPAAEAAPYDLDGDGRQDMVIGLPNWHKTKSGKEVGALVAFGSKRDVIGKVVVVTRKALGIPPARSTAEIGVTVASDDFDDDGRSDLALGAPFLDPNGGGVVIANGAGRRRFPGPSLIIHESREDEGLFGNSLVAGPLDDDGYADLSHSTFDQLILNFGSADGLAESPARRLAPPTNAPENPDLRRTFGWTQALGDVTGDGFAEVFTASRGIPDSGDDVSLPGRISVSPGTAEGPQESTYLAPEMRGGPSSLAVGDVNGDGYNDLVAGISENDFYGEDDPPPPGAVKIWFGSDSGLSEEPLTITQDSKGVPGSDEAGDHFGESIAVGFLDDDVYADIVVGTPRENRFDGRITVLRGGPLGISGDRNYSFGLRARAEGSSLSLLDMTGDGHPELVVVRGRGLNVLRGRKSGKFRPRGPRLRLQHYRVKPDPDEIVAPVLGRVASTD